MLIVLIILNLILIGLVLYLSTRKRTQSSVFQDLEGLELIEFQQNIKQLIDEIKSAAEKGVVDIDNKRKELEKTLRESEKIIKDMKYLMDRNKLMRSAEYKSEIANINSAVRKTPAVQEIMAAAGEPQETEKNEPKQKPSAAKFVLNEEREAEKVYPETNRYERVNNLINNGMSIEEISSVTGMSRGEIELIRNLKKK